MIVTEYKYEININQGTNLDVDLKRKLDVECDLTIGRGERGVDGLPGVDGTVSFEELTPNQIESLRGKKGDVGEKGDKGEQGLQGLKGEKGDKGDRGLQGLQGIQGIQGIQGLKGDKGDKGEPGQNGVSNWSDIQNKPSAFPPSNHSHSMSDITGLELSSVSVSRPNSKTVEESLSANELSILNLQNQIGQNITLMQDDINTIRGVL
ncbi:MAG: collagen-like triple helix repeat-containing protein [Paraclostridium sp.]